MLQLLSLLLSAETDQAPKGERDRERERERERFRETHKAESEKEREQRVRARHMKREAKTLDCNSDYNLPASG